ncbi:MAG: amine oxidase, partial [Candidatus Dormibacteria bacterium]
MSFFGRLFGGGAPAPAPTSVVIAPELASQLTAGGTSLSDAVDAALRDHLAEPTRAATQEEGERMPFWLAR